ncbi:hypothetical protein GCM10027174_36870 [Salinifilum aidingensis]
MAARCRVRSTAGTWPTRCWSTSTRSARTACSSAVSRKAGSFDTALDDHSRLACTGTSADEKAATCAEFLCRTRARFACHDITVERVLTGNTNARSAA